MVPEDNQAFKVSMHVFQKKKKMSTSDPQFYCVFPELAKLKVRDTVLQTAKFALDV